MSWPRSGMVLDQILPTFGPNHHKGIRIWSGAGPVLAQIRKKRIHAGIGPLCQKTPAQDYVQLYKNLVHIFAKRLKDVTLNRTNQTSRTSPNPANPTRHTSGNYIPANTSFRALTRAPPRASPPRASPPRGPYRASAPRVDPYRQRLSYNSPTTTAAEARQQQSPAQPDRPSYAQAVSGGVSQANAELHDIQHMLSII
ncbi:hypothetical protein G5714_004611 [Onychostoma macrolepis]|uniref:Uncharacterized protein n=1 Tax=Onychostoma macrolepis TaxID=369639 RepID=A0A7J6D548_9TELE|nr:hypothetical protein G5714_004611 [Onychostoma macrolepis]